MYFSVVYGKHLRYTCIPPRDGSVPSLAQMVKVPIGQDLVGLNENRRNQIVGDLHHKFGETLVPALKRIESRFEKSFPIHDIEAKVEKIDFKQHLELLGNSFRTMREAEVLTGGRVEIPACSLERLGAVRIKLDYETPKLPGIRFNSELMWSREDNEYSLYLDYGIAHIRDLETFEWLESSLPDAAYFDFYIPTKLKDKELDTDLVGSWKELSEATKRYQVYETISPKENRYSALLSIDDVHISLDLNLRAKQLHIRKHMYQGKSLSPTKVLERIERNDELVILTARIPLWLKQKMEREAGEKGEQLGTHLREVLEEKYDNPR